MADSALMLLRMAACHGVRLGGVKRRGRSRLGDGANSGRDTNRPGRHIRTVRAGSTISTSRDGASLSGVDGGRGQFRGVMHLVVLE